MATGKGFGKTILFGEHFVVYGLPAIAAALGDYTVAEIEAGKSSLEIIDNRPATPKYKETKLGERDRALDLMLKYLKIDAGKTPLKIKLSGTLICASGNGASAAMATSIARALNEHFSLGLNDEQINEVVYEGEKGSAGTPSGIDNTCATFGGLIVFEKNTQGGANRIERIKINEPVEIVLANSGITQETAAVVADVRVLKEKSPEEFDDIFEEYMALFESALAAFKKSDWENVGLLMNKNHELLKKMSVSCRELDEMQKIALDAGALGAKLTGTGRGGLLIALTPGKELQEKVAEAFENVGFKTLRTKIGV